MDYNPLLAEVKLNPYPFYAEMRRDHPVYRVEPFGFYAITRFDDVVNVLRNHAVFSSTGMATVGIDGAAFRTVINTDPPDHTRLRNIVNRVFTPRRIAELEPRIGQIVDMLITRFPQDTEFDLVSGLAIPLPVTVIAELLGVEPERGDDFKRWSDAVVGGIGGPAADGDPRFEGFREYFETAIEERRREPRDDLISTLVRAEAEEQALGPDEVLAFTVLLLIAGNETTTNLISNAMQALLEQQDQMGRLIEEPSLIPNMLEEALRYDAPVQFLFRLVMEDVVVAGTKIAKGSMVMPVFASANRDERRYADPDRFDLARDAQGHVAFGHGIHFCLGAPLARLEARIAFERLLPLLPRLRRTETPIERIDNMLLRGLRRLPLTLSGVAAAASHG